MSVDRQSQGGVNFRHTTRRCFSLWLPRSGKAFRSIGEDSKEGADAGIVAKEVTELRRTLAQSYVENDVRANVERRTRCLSRPPSGLGYVGDTIEMAEQRFLRAYCGRAKQGWGMLRFQQRE